MKNTRLEEYKNKIAVEKSQELYGRFKIKTQTIFLISLTSLDQLLSYDFSKKAVIMTFDEWKSFEAFYFYCDSVLTKVDQIVTCVKDEKPKPEELLFPLTGLYMEMNELEQNVDFILDRIYPELLKMNIAEICIKHYQEFSFLWIRFGLQQSEHARLYCLAFGGIGDLFMMLPVIQYLSNFECHTVITNNAKNKELLEHYLPNLTICNFMHLNCSISTYKNLMIFAGQQVIDLYPKLEDFYLTLNQRGMHGYTFFELICRKLPHAKTVSADQISRIIYENYNLKQSVKGWRQLEIVKELKQKYAYVITMQRQSSTTDKDGSFIKSWDFDQAMTFLEICRQHRIAVINLQPDEQNLPYCLDCSKLTIIECVNLICAADAHIGIDSCFGFASALVGTPSITLFSSSKLLLNIGAKLFMPMSNNLSLFLRDWKKGVFPAKAIFELIIRILKCDLCLDNCFKPLNERKDGVHYLFF